MNTPKALNFCQNLSFHLHHAQTVKQWLSLLQPAAVFSATLTTGPDEQIFVGKTFEQALITANNNANVILQMLWRGSLALPPANITAIQEDVTALESFLSMLLEENIEHTFNINACAQYVTTNDVPLQIVHYPMMNNGTTMFSVLSKSLSFANRHLLTLPLRDITNTPFSHSNTKTSVTF